MGAAFRMELDARHHSLLDGRDDATVVIRYCDNSTIILGLGRKTMGEVDVLPVEPSHENRRLRHSERVPAHMGHRSGSHPADRASEELEATATLVACTEQELHADADSENGTAGGNARAYRLVEPVCREPAGGALDVPDSGDHGERCVADGIGVGRDRRLCSSTLEGGRDRPEVAGAIVG